LPGDPIILAATKSGSIYEIQNLEVRMNIFIKSSHAPRKTPNDPQAENHWCTITMFLALLLPKAAPSLQRTGIEFRNTIAGLTLTLIVISQY